MKKEDIFELIAFHTSNVIPKLKEHKFDPKIG